jgi:hypothetical protein
MLKPDARVALLAATLPFACSLVAPPAGVARAAELPGPASGEWRAGAEVSGLLTGPELLVQARATAVRVNGVALQWRALASSQAPAQVAQLLGVGWRSVEPGADPAGAGQGWLLLTRRAGDELHALQLRADGRGGSEGYWSVLDPTRPASSQPRAPLSLPAGARVESGIEQLDLGLHSTQYLGRARQSPSALVERLRRAALAAGWVEQLPAGARAGFQAYARAGELLEVQVLAAGPEARFLLNVHQRGQAALEYLLVLITAVLVLFVPLFDGRSVAGALANAWRDAWATFSFLLSLS